MRRTLASECPPAHAHGAPGQGLLYQKRVPDFVHSLSQRPTRVHLRSEGAVRAVLCQPGAKLVWASFDFATSQCECASGCFPRESGTRRTTINARFDPAMRLICQVQLPTSHLLTEEKRNLMLLHGTSRYGWTQRKGCRSLL
jgi:hypothetical protein